MTSTVRVDWSGSVLHLELCRPERRNALSRQVIAELLGALGSEAAAKATAVVISGSGGAFSAGADFAELEGTAADAAFDDHLAEMTTAIVRLRRPVVAAIEGACLGAGCDLALACDMRVAGAGAVLGIPAVRLGLLYRPESIARIRRVVGPAVARRLLLTGERLDAVAAHRLGLVDEVVATGSAVERASSLVGALPAEAVDAVAATKALLVDLDEREAADVAGWRQTYFDLLSSPARQHLLGAAQRRHAPPETDPATEQ